MNNSEEYHLKGSKYRVPSPHSGIALQLVRSLYPDARPEGSVAHWTYFLNQYVVAEAWTVRGHSGDWWLRILDK